jgi:hypothetical protein
MTSFHFRHTAADRRRNASLAEAVVQRVNNMASQGEKASIEGVPRSTGRHGAVDLVAATMQEFSVFPACP